MKHKLLFIYLLISIFFYNNSKAQDFQWARQIGNQQNDEAESIEVDNNGNSYFIGVAQSYTYDLDPTPNGTQIIDNTSTPFSPYRDIYLIKLDRNGNFSWGKTFGNLKSGQYAYKVKIGPDGNIYLFLQTADLVPNQINSFITIIKISPEGNELSKINIKNPGSFFTDNFDVDNQNNFLISGWFVNSKTINFNNTNVKFESQNSIASYIFKLDNSGNFIWKKIFDTPQLSNVTIQTKPDGNIITVLNTSDKGYPMCSILNINTNDANVIWEKKLSNQAINTFHLDHKGNIVIAGTNGVFQGSIDVDPSTNVANTSSQKFLLWLDSNGNFLDLKEYFVAQFSADFRMWKIESDAQNNIYLVGDFAGKIDADPSSNVFFLENPYGQIQYGSGYAIKFDSSRNFEKAYTLISNYRSVVKDIKVKNKSIYLLGDFNGDCDFDPGAGNQIFDSLHNGGVLTSDGFVVKLSPCDPSKPDGEANQLFCTSKNATIGDLIPNFNGIKWYDSATNGNILSSSTSLKNGEIYYASQTENNCESTNRLAVTVSLISSLPANDYSELFCDDMNDGREIVNLSDYNSKLIATNATYNFNYYTSSQGAENELTADQISNFSNYNLVLGDNKIYVRINSNTPCYAIAELNLTLVSKPIISIQDVVPICENNTVIIDAGAGFDSYLWSTGATTASIIVTNPGNFDVTVTNNYSTISCSSTKTFTVKNSTIATINTIETKDWTDTENMITVHVTGAGDFEYSIDGIHFQDSNQFLNVHSGEYTVHVRDKNGCGTVTDEVYLLMYPKFFTPNGDGYNDTWKIKFSDLETSMIIKIFDRYGKLLKELTQNNSWDGTFNGQELPASDYWFAVTRNNGKEYKGHFSLKK